MKILLVAAFRGFKDEELFRTAEVLMENGVEVALASNKKGVALGTDGGEAPVDMVLEEVELSDWDGLYLIGGEGALKHLNNEVAHRLVRQAVERGMGLGAICIAPVVLAEAGVLRGKEATVWSTDLNKSAVKSLEKEGAFYREEAVVRDGSIITADGPESAGEFGRAILDFLREGA